MPTDGSANAPVLAGAMIRDARGTGRRVSTAHPRHRVGSRQRRDSRGRDRSGTRRDRNASNRGRHLVPDHWPHGRHFDSAYPMEHQYVETAPVSALGGSRLPNLRDPDNLVYFRQKDQAFIAGGYERNPRPSAPRSHAPKTPRCTRSTRSNLRDYWRLPPSACPRWHIASWCASLRLGVVYAGWGVSTGADTRDTGRLGRVWLLCPRRVGRGWRRKVAGRMDRVWETVD